MEFKGTKGKWVLLTGYKSCGVSIGNRSTMVFSNDCEEDLANALLISKAPEMLDMLNKINITISIHGKIDSETELHYQVQQLIKETTEI